MSLRDSRGDRKFTSFIGAKCLVTCLTCREPGLYVFVAPPTTVGMSLEAGGYLSVTSFAGASRKSQARYDYLIRVDQLPDVVSAADRRALRMVTSQAFRFYWDG